DWTLHKSFLPDEGLFRDHYNPQSKQFVHRPHVGIGRPLLDDGAYIQAYRHTGEKRYLDIAVRTAERLLKDEMPPGNWLKYQPCRRQIGSIHPRHAYWWGRPMLQLWETTGDADCLFAFQRSTDWYARAVRTDGGMFRDTRLDFSTSSFGHSTSASACAMMMFMDDYRENNAGHRIPLIKRTLDYCLNMQFTDTQDPNLKGCILEKIMPPDGTDRCPFHIRDVGTIFFVQALSQWLSAEAEQHLAAGITP
ncbi:MAG: hypothetical protein K9M45_09435, partial [Kiritimatiellales bacterium]|nr:hypothetical protein [Kiritimatiellales bacterium]